MEENRRSNGPSVVQKRYMDLVKNKRSFIIRGHSLIHKGEIFPVQMARHLGIKPTVDNVQQLRKIW